MEHPISSSSLQRFTAGMSSREENRSIVAHLLAGCASCAAAVRAALRPEIPSGAYDAAFARLTAPFVPVAEARLIRFPQPQPVVARRRARASGR